MKVRKQKTWIPIYVLLLLFGVLIGGVAVMTVRQKLDRDAQQIMNLACEREAEKIDGVLRSVQQSVNLEASYVQHQLGEAEQFVNDEAHRLLYTEDLQRVFEDIAQQTTGAVAYYVRYSEELVQTEQGFLYRRSAVDGDFEQVMLTDLSAYPEEDVEHVGWYYIPLRNGSSTWMEPYYNRNLGIYMISYVVPVFVQDTFIGVVGMDVNFQVILEQLSKIAVYSDGSAFLTNGSGEILYHPLLDYGTKMEDAIDGGLDLDAVLGEISSDGRLFSYRYNGVTKKLAFYSLENGMKLVVTASSYDIYGERNQLIILLLMVLSMICCGMIAILAMTKRDSERKAEQEDQNAAVAGLGGTGGDELRGLLNAYQQTVAELKQEIEYINSKAFRDGLTGLLNKSAYNEMMDELDRQILEKQARFGFIMLDVNDLKNINDQYGHERGDHYLKEVTELLSSVFVSDALYRIGGDEFLVLCQGDEVETIGEKLERLQETVRGRNKNRQQRSTEAISVAYGAAIFDPQRDTEAVQVFDRADSEMYATKQRMKREEV